MSNARTKKSAMLLAALAFSTNVQDARAEMDQNTALVVGAGILAVAGCTAVYIAKEKDVKSEEKTSSTTTAENPFAAQLQAQLALDTKKVEGEKEFKKFEVKIAKDSKDAENEANWLLNNLSKDVTVRNQKRDSVLAVVETILKEGVTGTDTRLSVLQAGCKAKKDIIANAQKNFDGATLENAMGVQVTGLYDNILDAVEQLITDVKRNDLKVKTAYAGLNKSIADHAENESFTLAENLRTKLDLFEAALAGTSNDEQWTCYGARLGWSKEYMEKVKGMFPDFNAMITVMTGAGKKVVPDALVLDAAAVVTRTIAQTEADLIATGTALPPNTVAGDPNTAAADGAATGNAKAAFDAITTTMKECWAHGISDLESASVLARLRTAHLIGAKQAYLEKIVKHVAACGGLREEAEVAILRKGISLEIELLQAGIELEETVFNVLKKVHDAVVADAAGIDFYTAQYKLLDRAAGAGNDVEGGGRPGDLFTALNDLFGMTKIADGTPLSYKIGVSTPGGAATDINLAPQANNVAGRFGARNQATAAEAFKLAEHFGLDQKYIKDAEVPFATLTNGKAQTNLDEYVTNSSWAIKNVGLYDAAGGASAFSVRGVVDALTALRNALPNSKKTGPGDVIVPQLLINSIYAGTGPGPALAKLNEAQRKYNDFAAQSFHHVDVATNAALPAIAAYAAPPAATAPLAPFANLDATAIAANTALTQARKATKFADQQKNLAEYDVHMAILRAEGLVH